MKVQTLIEELSKLDPDKEILHANLDYEWSDNDYSEIEILDNSKNEEIKRTEDFYSIGMKY